MLPAGLHGKRYVRRQACAWACSVGSSPGVRGRRPGVRLGVPDAGRGFPGVRVGLMAWKFWIRWLCEPDGLRWDSGYRPEQRSHRVCGEERCVRFRTPSSALDLEGLVME